MSPLPLCFDLFLYKVSALFDVTVSKLMDSLSVYAL